MATSATIARTSATIGAIDFFCALDAELGCELGGAGCLLVGAREGAGDAPRGGDTCGDDGGNCGDDGGNCGDDGGNCGDDGDGGEIGDRGVTGDWLSGRVMASEGNGAFARTGAGLGVATG